jgi:replicative DNA helicase
MIDLTEQTLPHNPEAERFVLGSVMLQPEAMHDIRPVVTADDFLPEKHRHIWDAMCAIYDDGGHVDRVTVANELQRRGELQVCGGISYIVSLDDGLPVITNLEDYVRIVQDKAVLRRIIAATENLQARCFADGEKPQQILDSIGQTILDLAPADKRRGFVSPSELIAQLGINRLLSPRRHSGIGLPWKDLDAVLCGLQPEQLILLAAHTSCGKTAAATQVAIAAAEQGVGVAIFSLELSAESLFRRMVYQISGMDAERHRAGKFGEDDTVKLGKAADTLKALPIYWNDKASCTVPAIHADLRKLRLRANIGLVIVDFLQIVRGTGRVESRNNEVGSNSRGLKLAAKEFQCPFLVLSQLKREGQGNEGRPPRLSDLRDSGEIEENSDVVWFIHRKSSDPENPIKASEFIIAKQREGPRGVSLPMAFLSTCQRFEMGMAEAQ